MVRDDFLYKIAYRTRSFDAYHSLVLAVLD